MSDIQTASTDAPPADETPKPRRKKTVAAPTVKSRTKSATKAKATKSRTKSATKATKSARKTTKARKAPRKAADAEEAKPGRKVTVEAPRPEGADDVPARKTSRKVVASPIEPAKEKASKGRKKRKPSKAKSADEKVTNGTQATAPATQREDTGAPSSASAPAASEGTAETPPGPPKAPIIERVITMSDRAIQRVTGGNAFLRGRLYARRKSVENLKAHGRQVSGSIQVRSQDEPYETVARIKDDGVFVSECTCPGHRGPDGHCKHVAALIVALRDRERPPRPKPEPKEQAAGEEGEGKRRRRRKKKNKDAAPAVHVPQTVSVGGKRRRSRRRRRGAAGEKLEVLSARDLGGALGESRGAVDAWLPPDALPKPHELEYRVTVRPTSITVTPVVAGTRNALPILDALQGFNSVHVDERPLLRHLSRHVLRGQPATAELRGEDAGEVLSLLEGASRVLLEPASMELRFGDEALKPTIELDTVSTDTLRTKVVFNLEGSSRRFQLSSGAWFEGTPGWHIDASDGVARPLDERVTPAWLGRLRSSPTLVHPLDAMERLLGDHIPRVAAGLGAKLPDLESIADLVDEQPVLQIWANGDIADTAAVVKVVYGDQTLDVPVQGFPSPLHIEAPTEEGARPRVIRRDIGAELNVVQTLMNHGFETDEDRLVIRGAKSVDFWSGGITELPEEWERYVPDDLAEVRVRSNSVTAQARVSSGVDWLSLDMAFSVDGASVSTDELRACLESGRSIVKLDDGSYAPVDPEQVGELLAAMAEIYAGAGDGSRLPLSQAGRIQSLLGLVPDSKVTPKAKTLFKKLENVDEIPSVAKPRTIKAELRPYQKKGFNWLAFVHDLASGGILADDMGLGKTLQTITLLTWIKSKAKKKKLNLVVAPTSVVPNWQREFAKFAPSMTTVVWQGPNRFDKEKELEKADVVFTSYALLRRDEEFLQSQDFRYIVLDEAQHIKNPASHTAKAAKKLQSERRLALTGTPIENRLSELWSIFDFASPGLLGDLKSFEEKVARPIDRGDEETARRLRSTIKPFVLRRLKIDVADDLPEKIEQERIITMSDAQSALYKQTLQEVRKSVMSEVEKKGVSKSQIQILAALTRLRQVACDPRLMKLENQEFSRQDSGKLEALDELIANAVEGGHRVLVFSQFVTMLGFIRDTLEDAGIPYEYLDGSTKDRIERVDRFNEDESVKVFLISLKAGGTGLNLTGADTVVHFDPWWNPAVEDQATDRAHRIGQTRSVNVYRLIAQGTVEEKILELSAKKRALMENVLSTEGSPLKGLTKKDVDSLFSD